ncbi:MAG: hypothetical protein J3Q66DRAFT_322215 [Benniella sp.]|nr:MAG: hypothetical protein J3Q66DRAFT_322215 [Benniella sp.]
MFGLKRSCSDFVVALSQPEPCSTTTQHSAIVTVKDQRQINISCSINGLEQANIELAAVSGANPFEGFKFASILDDDNMVRSFHIIGTKTKGMKIPLHKNYIQRNEMFRFKLLLVAISTSSIYKPSHKYAGSSGSSVTMSLVPPTQPNRPAPVASSSQPTIKENPTDTTPATPQGPLEAEQQPSSLDTIAPEHEQPKEHPPTVPCDPNEPPTPQTNTDAAPFLMSAQPGPGSYTQSSPLLTPEHISSNFDNSSTTSSSSSHTLAEETPYDILFHHYNPVKGTNSLIGAHRSILKAFPALLHLVERTEAARNNIATEMKLTVNEGAVGATLTTPIVVDISYLPYPAFKALIAYVYNQDVKEVLSGVSELIPTYQLTRSTEKEPASKVDQDKKPCLSELTFLAHRFEVRELFNVCVELTTLILSVDNAILILVHLGSVFEEIKRPVMTFVQDHFQEIFGQDDPFEVFQDRRECRLLMAEILRMIARRDMERPSSPFVMV